MEHAHEHTYTCTHTKRTHTQRAHTHTHTHTHTELLGQGTLAVRMDCRGPASKMESTAGILVGPPGCKWAGRVPGGGGRRTSVYMCVCFSAICASIGCKWTAEFLVEEAEKQVCVCMCVCV